MFDSDTDKPRFLAQYALEAVPRYTSYPPATGFHDGVGAQTWARWMAAAPAGPQVSLYLHIPFCKSMCWYCGCNTTIPNKRDRIERYLDALHREIEVRAEQLPANHRVGHIHFGGGSPDMLLPAEAQRLLTALHARFNIAGTAEIAFELDPRGVTGELADALVSGGANRASLGVQDTSEEVQRLIHRIQPRATVERAVSRLRRAGIAAINLDIMYGLPAQTVDRVRDTASLVAELDADRVAVFGYAHVPWFKKHQRAIPEDRLPGAEARFEQMLAAASTLRDAGYQAIGFDHFAKPHDTMAQALKAGALHRNFQGYTDDNYDILLGLGASAISEAPEGYAQNAPDPVRYGEAVMQTGSALIRGLERSTDDRAVASRIEALMCFENLALDDDMRRQFSDLETMQQQGLLILEGDRLRITPAGRPYIRNIAARIDPNFRIANNRHSRAV